MIPYLRERQREKGKLKPTSQYIPFCHVCFLIFCLIPSLSCFIPVMGPFVKILDANQTLAAECEVAFELMFKLKEKLTKIVRATNWRFLRKRRAIKLLDFLWGVANKISSCEHFPGHTLQEAYEHAKAPAAAPPPAGATPNSSLGPISRASTAGDAMRACLKLMYHMFVINKLGTFSLTPPQFDLVLQEMLNEVTKRCAQDRQQRQQLQQQLDRRPHADESEEKEEEVGESCESKEEEV
jgi:hypothetical protein